jgi:hypothetical protein
MPTPAIRYMPPALQADPAPCALIAWPRTAHEARFPFDEQIEIGRDNGGPDVPGLMQIAHSSVSRRHCVVFRRPDGRCGIRDMSRNGTRVDGRRLPPNVACALRSGQTISLTKALDLVLESTAVLTAPEQSTALSGATAPSGGMAVATLLVGDIRDYTVLVHQAPAAALQQCVNRIFEILSGAVEELGGSVKEYQGDALVAFWEGRTGKELASMACHAALELDRRVQQLATDSSVWQVEDFRLEMDWALATASGNDRRFRRRTSDRIVNDRRAGGPRVPPGEVRE